jgi:chromosome partitioning protein
LALAALITAIGTLFGGYAAYAHYSNERIRKRRDRLEIELEKERENTVPIPVLGRILWSKEPTAATDLPYIRSKKVISIGNFKGGVGKTTLSGNLAAYFSEAENKRVLLIDFDYQGSLSLSCARMVGARRNTYTAAKLIENAPNLKELRELALPLVNEDKPERGLQKVDMFTAFYPLDIQETQQLISWTNTPSASDVRYRLRDVLAASEFAEYEVVIIDCPPRFSTATINALCASTHLIVPTILDLLSSEAVTYFAQQLHELKTVFPNLNLVGVVPTMVTPGIANLTIRENRVAERINAEIRRLLGGESWVLRDAAVSRLAAIGKIAGEGVAYVLSSEAKDAFNSIGPKISRRLQ